MSSFQLTGNPRKSLEALWEKSFEKINCKVTSHLNHQVIGGIRDGHLFTIKGRTAQDQSQTQLCGGADH